MRKSLWRSLLFAIVLAVVPHVSAANVSVDISVNIAPPPLPVYTQPVCPGAGYIWTPGYWAYGPAGYYWVPGTWVLAPQPGFLWTPGYWGWSGNVYVWHGGYWGPHVGFYGGINYGFGYVGVGYLGGRWNGGVFEYNRTVNNVNVTIIHNTYNERVVNRTVVNHVSFNGGRGGVDYRPSREEQMYSREQHVGPSGPQVQHERSASTNRAQFASVNHGRPSMAATSRPGEFNRGNAQPRRNVQRNNTPRENIERNNAPRGNESRPAPQVHESNRAPQHEAERGQGGRPHGGAQPHEHGGGGGNEHHDGDRH